ncbi:hypothetical protein AB6A40_002794 [Gnathostoma spinigerum]|uniref:Uncharacterized protein n=1 Tax=Gnathostoma spinigerum TaxID=75299 RepID=A0ABD6E7L6_9BILA
MLEFEVVPDCSLRSENLEFILGMPINQVIALIQNVPRQVHNVELTYDPKDILSRDITIQLVDDGVRLYFEPDRQLLRLIEVYDLSKVVLKYRSKIFSQPGESTDINKVESCFGGIHHPAGCVLINDIKKGVQSSLVNRRARFQNHARMAKIRRVAILSIYYYFYSS